MTSLLISISSHANEKEDSIEIHALPCVTQTPDRERNRHLRLQETTFKFTHCFWKLSFVSWKRWKLETYCNWICDCCQDDKGMARVYDIGKFCRDNIQNASTAFEGRLIGTIRCTCSLTQAAHLLGNLRWSHHVLRYSMRPVNESLKFWPLPEDDRQWESHMITKHVYLVWHPQVILRFGTQWDTVTGDMNLQCWQEFGPSKSDSRSFTKLLWEQSASSGKICSNGRYWSSPSKMGIS